MIPLWLAGLRFVGRDVVLFKLQQRKNSSNVLISQCKNKVLQVQVLFSKSYLNKGSEALSAKWLKLKMFSMQHNPFESVILWSITTTILWDYYYIYTLLNKQDLMLWLVEVELLLDLLFYNNVLILQADILFYTWDWKNGICN